LIKTPGSNTFVPLVGAAQIPVGSIVDTTKGTVELTSATGSAKRAIAVASAKTQTAQFYDGVFQVQQNRGAAPITTLSLRGGNFAICRPRRVLAAKAPPKKPVRRLWGKGKGRFRTKAKYSSATVRGTTWLVADRCDGTLTKVVAGRVAVRDFVRGRTLLLRAGQSYVARPRGRR
jgi:ferric-dicitrate binding protein FerR (iron transport regulator)